MALRTFTDQLGNQITIPFPPQRIVSLVPSQTELLADLGLGYRVVGITKFCVHPSAWQKPNPSPRPADTPLPGERGRGEGKTIIGGTKSFRFDLIKSLQPDLIIGNKEENYQEGIELLKTEYPVWMSDIVTIEDALAMIQHIGVLTETDKQANELVHQITDAFLGIEKLPSLRTLYLIWRSPWMAAASGTFIHELLTLAGLQNCLEASSRYPELSEEEMKTFDPQLILLSSEPYPFQQKHVEEIQKIYPRTKILLVDGEMFSWYGSRLSKFPDYLKTIRPRLH